MSYHEKGRESAAVVDPMTPKKSFSFSESDCVTETATEMASGTASDHDHDCGDVRGQRSRFLMESLQARPSDGRICDPVGCVCCVWPGCGYDSGFCSGSGIGIGIESPWKGCRMRCGWMVGVALEKDSWGTRTRAFGDSAVATGSLTMLPDANVTSSGAWAEQPGLRTETGTL